MISQVAIQQRERLNEILRRFVREEDAQLTDDAFVRVVMARYEEDRYMPLIDPNE